MLAAATKRQPDLELKVGDGDTEAGCAARIDRVGLTTASDPLSVSGAILRLKPRAIENGANLLKGLSWRSESSQSVSMGHQ